MRVYFSVIVTIVIFLGSCKTTTYVSGTGPDPFEHISKLKEGTLIVFLHSYRDQLLALKNQAEMQNIEDKKELISRKYNQVIAKRNAHIDEIIGSFTAHYDFSEVAFSFDHQLSKRADGDVVIDELLADKSTQKRKLTDNTYFLKYTMDSKLDGTHTYDWDVLTLDGMILEPPFPNIRNKLNIWDLPGRLLNNKKKDMGADLNQSFEKFYSKNVR